MKYYKEKRFRGKVRNPFLSTKYDDKQRLFYNYIPKSLPTNMVLTTFTRNLFLYIDTIPNNISEDLKFVLFNILNITQYNDHKKLSSVLSALSAYAKKELGEFYDYWTYFVGLDCFLGYSEQEPQEWRYNDIKEWVYDPVEHKVNGSVDKYNEYFSIACDELIREAKFNAERAENPISIDEYLDRGIWMKGRSSDTRPALLLYKNIIKRGKRSKLSSALELNKYELTNMLMNSKHQVIRSFQKLESGKVRDIAGADFNNYIKMDYISTIVDNWFYNHPAIPLSYAGKRRTDMWLDLLENCDDTSLMKIPLDQSNFDHNISRDMIKIMLSCIQKYLPNEHQYKHVMSKLIEGMMDEKSYVKCGNIDIPWRKGLASGWRWTALLNSLFNYAEFLVVKRVLKEKNISLDIKTQYFLGDDVELTVNCDENVAQKILDTYDELGMNVNPMKNIISRKRNEFLRNVLQNKTLCGYPARVVLNLCYNKPLTSYPHSKYDRISNLITNYLLYIQRGAKTETTIKIMLNCLYAYLTDNRITTSINQIICYILTPKSVGGYGLSRHDRVYNILMKILDTNITKKHDCNFHFVSLEPTYSHTETKIKSTAWLSYVNNLRAQTRLNVPEFMFERNLIDTLPSDDRHKKVDSFARFIDVATTIGGCRLGTNKLTSLKANLKRTIKAPSVYRSTLMEYIADNYKHISDIDNILDQESIANLKYLISRNVSHSVIKNWILGRFETCIPVYSFINSSSYAHYIDLDEILKQAICARSSTMNNVKNALLYIEYKCDDILINTVRRDSMHATFKS